MALCFGTFTSISKFINLFKIWVSFNLLNKWQAFFHRWWVEQSPETQEQVKKLVDAGQLEFMYASAFLLFVLVCVMVQFVRVCVNVHEIEITKS